MPFLNCFWSEMRSGIGKNSCRGPVGIVCTRYDPKLTCRDRAKLCFSFCFVFRFALFSVVPGVGFLAPVPAVALPLLLPVLKPSPGLPKPPPGLPKTKQNGKQTKNRLKLDPSLTTRLSGATRSPSHWFQQTLRAELPYC